MCRNLFFKRVLLADGTGVIGSGGALSVVANAVPVVVAVTFVVVQLKQRDVLVIGRAP